MSNPTLRGALRLCMRLLGGCWNGGAGKQRGFGLALAACMFGATAASGEQVTIQLVNPLPTEQLQFKLNNNPGLALAGFIHWTKLAGGGGLPTNFVTVCVDLTQHVVLGGTYVMDIKPVDQVPQPGGGMGVADANLIRELWGTYRSQVVNAATEAAFQTAVWEIVFDEGLDLSSGNFQSNYGSGTPPSWLATAQTWLSSLGKGQGTLANLIGLSNLDAQDQIACVPVPPGVWLFSLGSLGLVAGAWRRRQSSAKPLAA